MHRLPLVEMSRGYSLVAVCGLLIAVALGAGVSGAAAHRLTCPMVCGIFPEQGLNLSPALAGRCLTYEPPGKSLLSPSFGALGGGMSTSDLGLCVCIRLSVMCGSRAFLVVDLLDLTSESSE